MPAKAVFYYDIIGTYYFGGSMANLWVKPEDTIDPSGPYTLRCIEAASWLLYKLTAEKYPGTKTVTECYSDNIDASVSIRPTLINGNFYNITSSDYNRKLHLRHGPVLKINSISSNGTLLPSTAYQLRNNAFIVRSDRTSWNLSPVSELCVDYDYGLNPPEAGKHAALILANEFIRYHTTPSQCSLPERVTSVSRQQVSFSVLDPHTFLNEGKVGIYLVDSFITTANPSRAKKRPKVFSPDRPNGERIN
jgi:hypothetical protein